MVRSMVLVCRHQHISRISDDFYGPKRPIETANLVKPCWIGVDVAHDVALGDLGESYRVIDFREFPELVLRPPVGNEVLIRPHAGAAMLGIGAEDRAHRSG